MNLRRCFVRPVLLVFLSGVLVFLNALVCLANNPGGFTTLVTTARYLHVRRETLTGLHGLLEAIDLKALVKQSA